jgi:hypothetical protein
MIRYCFVVFFFVYLNVSFSQEKITQKQAIDDAEITFKLLNEIHPNLFQRMDSIAFRDDLMAVNSEGDSVLVLDFQLHLRKSVNLLNDGHTYVSLTNYPDFEKIYQSKLSSKIVVEEGKLFINSLSADSSRFLEIRSIDNRKSSDIYSDIQPFLKGEIVRFKEIQFGLNFTFYYQLSYGQCDEILIEFENGEKEIRPIIKVSETSENPDFLFKYLNDSTAVLQLNTFAFSNEKAKNYKGFIDSCFREIYRKGIGNLLIDVSKHEGGNSEYGDFLMNYISQNPYQNYSMYEMKRSRYSKRYYKKRFLSWYLYPVAIFSKQARIVILKKEGIENLSVKKIKPRNNKYLFKGKISLMISEQTYSAGATFVSGFKNANCGKVFGTETGQPCRGFIELIPFKLPNSSLWIACSTKVYEYVDCEISNAGIPPDVYLKRNKEDDDLDYYLKVLSFY